MGLGVGNALFTGAIEAIYKDRQGHIEDRILMRPFPQFIPDESERNKIWEQYRQDIISSSGIALFLFGNKKQGDCIVVSDGMIREFEIARDHGLTCIPVGATGHAAAEIYGRLTGEDYGGDQSLIELSNSRENLNELIAPILQIASATRK